MEDDLNFLKTDLSGQYNFEERFIKTVRTILDETGISNRRQGLLTNGYQTYGNLFDIEQGFTENIQEVKKQIGLVEEERATSSK